MLPKRRFLLIFIIISSAILISAAIFQLQPIKAATAQAPELSTRDFACRTCHLPVSEFSTLHAADPCNACHERAEHIKPRVVLETIENHFNNLEAQVSAYMISASPAQKHDPRYRVMVDSLWQAEQLIYVTMEEEAPPALAFMAHSEALLAQLVNEARFGFWVAVDSSLPPLRSAILTSLSSSSSNLYALGVMRITSTHYPPVLERPVEFWGLLVLALCVIFAVLRRSPPDEAYATTTLILLASWRAPRHFVRSPILFCGGMLFKASAIFVHCSPKEVIPASDVKNPVQAAHLMRKGTL